MNILIKNGKVWDGEKMFLSDVLVSEAKIAKIEKNISDNADFVYDAEGKIVSAGLVDIHTHMKGISSDDFAINTEMVCIPFGVTCAFDAAAISGDEALIDTFAVKTGVFVAVDVIDNHIIKESVEEKIKLYGKKAEGLKIFFDTTSPEIRDITPLTELCEYAETKNLKVLVHSSNSPVPMCELLKQLRKGDILTHAYHGGKNNSSEDNFESIKQAKARGVIIDVGFAGHIHTDFKVLKQGIECGALPNTISTDITRCSAYLRGGKYGMTMCMSIAKHLGMEEKDIFAAVTSDAAKAVGKENECGYLKVGRNADIAVFDDMGDGFDLTDRDGNRICSDKGYRCVLTLVDGEVLYRV